MKFLDRLSQPLHVLKQKGIDFASLQLRLTLGITTVSLLGVGSMGMWTTWQMRQMLVVQHQDYLQAIGDRIPAELKAAEAVQRPPQPMTAYLQKLVDAWASPSLWLWVKSEDGRVLAQSSNLASFPGEAALMPAASMPSEPIVSAMNGNYLVLCSQPLRVNGESIGQVYLAQDITHDYTVLNRLTNSLRWATAIAVAVIATLIAYWVWRSLHPLRQMNRLAIAAGELDPTEMDQVPSEVKELVSAFSNLSTRLSEADAQQRQFTSSISHEIRTSLSLVYGYLQSTLRRCTNLTAPQKEALEVAVEETERTIQLLKDLIDLARLNSESMEFQLKPVALNDLVEMVILSETATPNDPTAPTDAPTLELKADSDLIVAQADPSQLLRVLKHLIDNARRYAKTDKPIVLHLSETKDTAVVEVCDRGCGIPLTDQAHLFEPFYRVEASRCRSTGGIGLGLAIVKSLVEGMHGQVSVYSQPGKGSVFTVKLPKGVTEVED
ncbi:HAMP domain-containing histidine kinase [Phormidium tenue FACHB-886]|nr:HAMP domain-containing histidine kinase [Phormidium tenue FACHB-886]